MYCLKVDKVKKNVKSDSLNVVAVADTQYLSFDNFEKLYKEKQMFDKKVSKKYEYQTSVYKVSNNGLRVEKLSDKSLYSKELDTMAKHCISEKVENMESEMTDSFKSYSFLKQILEKDNFDFKIISGYDKDKYSKYGILLICGIKVERCKVEKFLSKGVGRPKKIEIVTLEIEKVKSTPKYEIRILDNGVSKIMFCESTQNEIVRILNNDYGIVL